MPRRHRTPRRLVTAVRIIVLGYMVRGPLGGMVWSDLHYLMGLRALGHDVSFLEDSDDYASCYDPRTDRTDIDPQYGLEFTARVLDRHGFGDRWAYHDAHTSSWHGPLAARAADLKADVVLNLAGVNPLREWHRDVPVRVLVDQDPAFTQIRHLREPRARARAKAHNRFVTFAENIGEPDCLVPDDGFPWVPTRQPVVATALHPTPGPAEGRYTSVLQWSSYSQQTHEGVSYGMKAESFAEFLDLPRHLSTPLELAVGADGTVQAMLRDHGWQVVDPRPPTADPWTYEEYLRGSKGELGIAKHGYVASRSGWFSERSTAYMALGRPVVVQETGFSRWLPTDAGVLAFSSVGEAAEGLHRVDADYGRHSRVAREVVREHFDARRVLSALLDAAVG